MFKRNPGRISFGHVGNDDMTKTAEIVVDLGKDPKTLAICCGGTALIGLGIAALADYVYRQGAKSYFKSEVDAMMGIGMLEKI